MLPMGMLMRVRDTAGVHWGPAEFAPPGEGAKELNDTAVLGFAVRSAAEASVETKVEALARAAVALAALLAAAAAVEEPGGGTTAALLAPSSCRAAVAVEVARGA